MSIKNSNSKILSLFIALASFFILVFITTSIYSNLQATIDLKNTNEKKLENLNNKLSNLNNLKKLLANDKNNESKKIKKFTTDFSEDNIIEYINDYIEDVNTNIEKRVVLAFESISFSEPKKSELGFKEINIDLKLVVSDRYVLNNLLNYLISDDNKYSFFITELNFPIEKSGPYSINIPLKMYVK